MSDTSQPSAADRLLDAAARLFYARGVPNVGINEIIARAGVARMTLYHHFPSKDALVKAVLDRRKDERDAWLAQAAEMASEPRGRILAVFDLLRTWAETPDFRGCPLVAATIELGGQLNAARPYAQAHQATARAFFETHATELGVPDAGALAAQLQLLVEGAAVVALVQGGPVVAQHARTAAAALLDAAVSSAKRTTDASNTPITSPEPGALH